MILRNRMLHALVGMAVLAGVATMLLAVPHGGVAPKAAMPGVKPSMFAPVAPARHGGNPLAGVRLYVDPNSQALQAAAADAHSDPVAAALLHQIASEPTGLWMGSWFPVDKVAGIVSAAMRAAAAQAAEPLLVLYGFPLTSCAQDSGAGAAYERWLGQVAAGIGSDAAVVVIEPDALAQDVLLSCLTPAQQRYRLALIRSAVEQTARLPGTTVYLDAGNSRWKTPNTMAPLLEAAGVSMTRGFSLNVSNFNSTADEESYGDRLSALLHGKHFVIDTSRNGNATAATWCNPPGQALGTSPTTVTGDRRADALLWIKAPGSSDGTCNGGPPAGIFWPSYALTLATNAHRT
jgi:endoglucanase